MSDTRLTPYGFDRGLTEVRHARSGDAAQLPAQRLLDPAESLSAPPLQQLLGAAQLGSVLGEALLPPIEDRAQLRPAVFQQSLAEGRDALREAARQSGDPALARAFSAAARLLDDDLQLRDLAAMYRGVLHQG